MPGDLLLNFSSLVFLSLDQLIAFLVVSILNNRQKNVKLNFRLPGLPQLYVKQPNYT